MRGPRFRSTPSVKNPATPWSAPDAIASWNPKRVVSQPPELQPQAAASAHTRAEDDGEQQVGGDADAFDERARHDQRRRHGEEDERQEEDEAQVVRRVRAEPRAPRGACAAEAGDAAESGARMAVL